jgi:pyruvate formate lyase activating enzyme
VRFNDGGTLKVPWGYISGCGPDPVEKKPFFHALPGARTFSYGMLGCNFKCSFCQNHLISQIRGGGRFSGAVEPATPEQLAASAREAGAAFIVSTYNEPLITSEWNMAVFKEARKSGIRGAYVSNAYASREVLEYIRPHVDLYKADLKTFSAENYARTAGGKLSAVLKSVEMIHSLGFWLEIVTLVIPGFNDSDGELASIAGFIAGLSRDIPWHVTAFHPDHNMTDRNPTPAGTLLRAREAGLGKGLRYVYTGNIPGGGFEDTLCYSCGRALIRRRGYKILENSILLSGTTGKCPACSAKIPGVGV